MANVVSETADLKVGEGDMTAFAYRPEGEGKFPAVIVIQEIFGVDGHIKDVANRFANEGYVAAAPDLFHRAGQNITVPYSDGQQGGALRGQLSQDDILADVKATVEYLQGHPNVDANNIGIVGFCFGGYVSYLAAARVPGLKAAAIYYGGGILPRPGSPADAPRVLDQTAADINVPLIAFWGDKDAGIPPELANEIEAKLKGLGKSIESHIYPEAGHGFFCDERGSYNEAASKDAWPKTLDFFAKHLKGARVG
ncbi:MAG: dienelactone hydrolase family protein [Dehalococcoidia bacterium]